MAEKTFKGKPKDGQPGWYPDPNSDGWERYWDGKKWTNKERDGGEVGASKKTAGSQAEETETIEVNRAGMGLAFAGAAIVTMSVFLPRVESTKFTEVVENTLIQSGNGFWFILIALVVVADTYRAYAGGKRTYAVLFAGIFGVLMAIYAGTGDRLILESVGPNSFYSDLTDKASPSIGIYGVGVGSLVILCGGFLLAGWDIGSTSENRFSMQKTRKCPDCAETVLVEARVCKHCGKRFRKSNA